MGKSKKNKGKATTPPKAAKAPVADAPPPPGAPEAVKLLRAIQVAMAVAMLAAGYLLYAFVAKHLDPTFESICKVSDKLDCDKLNLSRWGKIGGIPITVFALASYGAFIALAQRALTLDDGGRGALKVLLGALGGAVLYGLALLYVMLGVEDVICLFCLTMDGMTLLSAGLAFLALKKYPAGDTDFMPGLKLAGPVAAVLLLLLLGWYGNAHSKFEKQSIAEADTSFDATGEAAAVAEAAKAAAAGAVLKGKKIDDKNYLIPVRADDAVWGPADAKVTVIEYADFQCGYCKKLFYNLKPLKEKYKDESVRFVFKHFPMNKKCNSTINNDRHRYACDSAVASVCALRQDTFWPMHDLLFKNQHKLKADDLQYYARDLGLDMAAFNSCLKDSSARDQVVADVTTFDEAEIPKGTPRTFINGRFFKGVVPQATLEHVIEQELGRRTATERPQASAKPKTKLVPAKSAPLQVEVPLGDGSFWIDSFESSVDASGKALSMPGVLPANASWFEADQACRAAGKRTCTTEEWVTACQGARAIDDDNDGNFANDYVEGNQFPYADWYEPGWCRTTQDRDTGAPGKTGGNPRCQTPTGIFDLGGNLAEWVGGDEATAVMLGGDYRSKDKSGCFRPASTFGPGHKNIGIGFRCCSDAQVATSGQAVEAAAPRGLIGAPVPEFTGELMDGGSLSSAEFKGKVTYLSFYASWCGPCRRELPELNELHKKYAAQGFQVIAVGVDSDQGGKNGAALSRAMAKKYKAIYPVILDPSNEVLGHFDVQSMPTTYIIDKAGVIRHKQVGFGDNTLGEVTPVIEGLL